MSAVKRLEHYIDAYENQALALSSSRLAAKSVSSGHARLIAPPQPARGSILPTFRNTPTNLQVPTVSSRREVSIEPDGSVDQDLDYFVANLRRRATVRAHELKQLRRMLVADVDWECDFSTDMKLSAIIPNRSDMSEDEFQSLLLGDSMNDMPKHGAGAGSVSAASSDFDPQAPLSSSMEWSAVDYDRMQTEKLQRLHSLSRALAPQSTNQPPPPPPAPQSQQEEVNIQPLSRENLPSKTGIRRYSPPEVAEHRKSSSTSKSPPIPKPSTEWRRAREGIASGSVVVKSPVDKLDDYLSTQLAPHDISRFLHSRSDSPSTEAVDLFSLADEELHIAGATPSKIPKTPSFNPLFS